MRSGVVLNILNATQDGRKRCLKQLFDDLGHCIFQHGERLDMDEPPAEMFQRIAFPDLWGQYLRFQLFAATLAAEGEATRVQTVEMCFDSGERAAVALSAVRFLAEDAGTADGNLLGKRVTVNTRTAVAASSCGVGTTNSLKGRGSIVAIHRTLDDDSLYESIMTCAYPVIQHKGLWHIVWLYHHCAMRCICTETMCETANSALRLLERRNNTGRPWATQALVEATRLRCSGLRGDLGDGAFIWRALLRQFGQMDHEADLPFFVQHRSRRRQKRTYTRRSPIEGQEEGIARSLAADLMNGALRCQFSRAEDFGGGPLERTAWRDTFTNATWAYLRQFLLRQRVDKPSGAD